jgi:hypothetical protein
MFFCGDLEYKFCGVVRCDAIQSGGWYTNISKECIASISVVMV